MQLDAIRAYINTDLVKVDHVIGDALGSDVHLIREMAQHIFGSGGKRLRPILVLLSAQAFNYAGNYHYYLAAAVELIHTATLLHDDVVDESSLRRGKKTANAVWGNQESVLVGDFLYSRAFQMLVTTDNLAILSLLADVSNIIAEGEVLQLLNIHENEVSEANYLNVIQRKTAMLFSAASHASAILCKRSEIEKQAMADYGLYIGTAFQLVDDILDYGFSSSDIGKNVGDDLAESKPTLPIIYAIQQSNEAQKAFIKNCLAQGEVSQLPVIKEILESTNSIAYTYDLAKDYIDKAIKSLEIIPDSSAKNVMIELAHYVVSRQT
ncbi:MAG: polyprenyl synthetase family protein [Gammaproteobacteria bacterium]